MVDVSGRPGGLENLDANQAVAMANPQFSCVDNIDENTGLANPIFVVFDAEKSEDQIDETEAEIRKMRATALVLAIRDTHPNDARQLLTAALIDLSAGMPPSDAFFPTVREDARWWAGLATPAELMEVLSAALDSLRNRAMHLDMRKRLFMRLWRSFSPQQQGAFLSFARKGGPQ